MALSGKKSKKTEILERIYHEQLPVKPKKPKDFIQEFFRDQKKVQNLLSVAILVLGLAGLGLGFFQFKYNIKKSFLPKKSEFGNLANANINGNNPQDLLGLSQKDTDGDGLSDYDEVYTYGSSAYLKDSDSDGVDDKTEVARQTDPNCAAGKQCFTESFAAAADSNNLLFDQTSQVSQLRLLLKQAGVSDEELSQLSDSDLVAAYQEILAQGQNQTNPQTTTKNDLSDLTPSELRQVLRASGISQSVLDGLSDEELLQLAAESMAADDRWWQLMTMN